MQGFPFLPLDGSVHEFYFATVSDTAQPIPQVPIYFIHSLNKPLCTNPDCSCHKDQAAVRQLLLQVNEGLLTLREAANLQAGKQL